MSPLLKTIECPSCKTAAIFLWNDGREALCESCIKARTTHDKYGLLLTPTRTVDGNWKSDDRIRFPELRQYIDDCLSNDHRRSAANLLTADATAIENLIAILESLVPPHPLAEDGTVATGEQGAL